MFIRQAGLFAAGTLAYPGITGARSPFTAARRRSYGLQLFTLTQPMLQDPAGTLRQVAAIGYKELETAYAPGSYFYGYKPRAFAEFVSSLGMTVRAQHVLGAPFDLAKLEATARQMHDNDPEKVKQLLQGFKFLSELPTLTHDVQRIVDDAAEAGISYLVCSSIPVGNMDEIKAAVEVFNRAGEACKKAGLQFAYHNHSNEFDPVEGTTPFDYILNHTDPQLVKMELDLGWTAKAGKDPVQLFGEHKGRFPLWHIKDFNADFTRITEVGAGIIDFKRVFAHAKDSGMRYFFLEQDNPPEPLVNVTNGLHNLQRMLD